jgi:hypothetical protein
MGWRDVIAGALYEWDAGINPEPSRSWVERKTHDPENAMFYETFAGCAHKALLAMPPSDRIALARELLAGTGYVPVVLPDEWDTPGDDPLNVAYADGWNDALRACRAVMLGEGE